jgi:hypothetical protein
MHRAIVLIPAFWLFSVTPASPGAQALSGCYENSRGKDANFSYGSSVILSQRSPSALEFHYEEVGGGGDLCVAHGIARRESLKPSQFLFVAKESDSAAITESGSACAIRITVESAQIVFGATAGDCGGHFSCGARNTVGDRFTRRSRKVLGKSGCEMPKAEP